MLHIAPQNQPVVDLWDIYWLREEMTWEEIIVFNFDNTQQHKKYISGGFNFDNIACSTENTLHLTLTQLENFQPNFLGVSCEYFQITGFVFVTNLFYPLLCNCPKVTISYITVYEILCRSKMEAL